jgi:glutaredoxin
MSVLRQVIVYSRKGCHLCEIVKETLAKLHRRGGFTWKEVDVDSDEQLRRQFTDEVPVVFIDGRKAFKYRIPAQAGQLAIFRSRFRYNLEPHAAY